MPLKIAIVCEAEADFFTATALAERVIRANCDWADDVLPHCPLWYGANGQGSYLRWKDVPAWMRRHSILPSRGHFSGEPAEPDAHAAQRALRILLHVYPDLDAIVL